MHLVESTYLKRTLILWIICLVVFTDCKKKETAGIELEMVTVTTKDPANVRILFQVDAGNDENETNLAITDVEIYENNTLLTSLESQAQIQDEPGEFLFSTLLLLDFSGSVLNDEDLDQLKDAVTSFIELVMQADTTASGFGVKEMAIYWFNGEEEIHPLVDYSFYKDSLLAGVNAIVDTMSTDFSTNLNGAVMEGVYNLESKISEAESDLGQSNIVNMVLFTDGIDIAGRQTEEEALVAIELLTNQYLLYSIGLGEDVDKGFLENIGPAGNQFAETSNDLNSAFLDMAAQVNQDFQSFVALEYCSPKRSGDHIIQIRTYIEDRVGRFDTELTADGFGGGCVIE